MRLYSIVNNGYLSQTQNGIQTTHAVARMSLQNNENFKRWVESHETVIILGGWNQLGLETAHQKLLSFKASLPELANFPIQTFNEDMQSLNGALTSVAMIVPEVFYSGTFKRERDGSTKYIVSEDCAGGVWTDDPESAYFEHFSFAKYLASFKLA